MILLGYVRTYVLDARVDAPWQEQHPVIGGEDQEGPVVPSPRSIQRPVPLVHGEEGRRHWLLLVFSGVVVVMLVVRVYVVDVFCFLNHFLGARTEQDVLQPEHDHLELCLGQVGETEGQRRTPCQEREPVEGDEGEVGRDDGRLHGRSGLN